MRYKCIVSYDGSQFHGFQIQGDMRTVQLEIEKVLLIITKVETRIYPSGRTDTGVHALGQVFHFDTDIVMKEWNMQNAINSRLPKDIYIRKVEIVDENFHARFSATGKIYHYLIDIGEYNPLLCNYRYYYHHPLNLEAMIRASKLFIGEHDFKTFTKNHKLVDTVRTVHSLEFEINQNLITIKFYGNGFMHNMVRIIIAMLIEVGRGHLTEEDLQKRMDCKNRAMAPKIAPASGLYLMEVKYNNIHL